MDPVSHLLSLVTILGARPSRLEASGAWSVRYPAELEARVGHVRRGHPWVWPRDRSPRRLGPGDCFVLAPQEPCSLASDPDLPPRDGHEICVLATDGVAKIGSANEITVEGGQIALDRAGAQLLFGLLPPLVVIAAGDRDATAVRGALARFFTEAGSAQLGATLAAGHLGQLVCLAALRSIVDDEEPHLRGWLAAIADPTIGEVVRALHADPARPWTVAEMAESAYMARSSFTARFRSITGETPLAHVTALRMRVAGQRLRRSDHSIAAIADELGYSSEAAFSRAFKRFSGVPPSAYRNALPGLRGS